MLTVKTYLAPSSVHGIGLFAAENIPAQDVVWKFNDHVDKQYSHEHFLRVCDDLNECTLKHILNSSYRRGDSYFYLTDNARFINHSVIQKNIIFVDDYTEIAIRDISAHEELFEDYNLSYDPADFFFQELLNPDPYTYISHMIMHGYRSANC